MTMALQDKDKEYDKKLSQWQQTRAAIGGKPEVMEIVSSLPNPQYKQFTFYDGMSEAAKRQALIRSNQNNSRVKAYWSRGRFFPATARTFESLGGMVWSKDPKSELQPQLEYLTDKADLTGFGLREIAQKVTDELLITGRYAILVDMPSIQGSLTPAQIERGEGVPYFVRYKAEQIKYTRGNEEVRLSEVHSIQDGEFKFKDVEYTRRLVLINGVYHNQLFNEKDELISDIEPRANGRPMNYIPIQFFGADENSAEFSRVPLYDLANINLGHFVLDCDNRDNLHYHGQGMTVVSTDLTPEEFNEANPNGLDVGARGMNQLKAGDKVEVIQIAATGAIPTEMDRDEKRMVMAGAQLVTDTNSNQTLGAKRIDSNASTSQLKRITNNISDGFTQLLEWVSEMLNVKGDSYYKLNTEFITDDVTPEMLNAHFAIVQSGGLPQITLNDTARRAGLTDLDDEELEIAMTNQNELLGGTSEEQAAIQAQLDAALEELAALKANNG
jgi:hypothetical protein